MGILRQNINSWALTLVGVTMLGLGSVAIAQQPEQSAHEFAEHVKDELVRVIRSKSELEQEGGEAHYIAAVQKVLEPVVDFGYIARGVMGNHAKTADADQRRRFVEEFKQSLVNTYAKGLAGYGNYDITVVPADEDVSDKRTVSVWLNVSSGDVTHRLAFTVRLNPDGEWKVVNMILNGINLGHAFRGQFDNAMKQRNGDIDAVIENWRV